MIPDPVRQTTATAPGSHRRSCEPLLVSYVHQPAHSANLQPRNPIKVPAHSDCVARSKCRMR